MNLQPEDFWSYYEWLMRPNASFFESALLQGIVLIVFLVFIGTLIGYIFAAARYGPVEGFYSVARAIRDLVTRDLPGTSPRRIWGLARLSFKEAIRRRVLFVVALFAIILLFAGWFLNDTSNDPARLYISFVLTTVNFLMLFLALFISTFSIPADIKDKTIYTIVTKPVRATELILGRMLGFIGVGTAMLVPMGLLSFLFVSRVLDHDHAVIEAVVEDDGRIVGKTDRVRNHEHTFTIEPGETNGLTNRARGHIHIVRKIDDGGETRFELSDPKDAFVARIPLYGDVQFFDRSGNPVDKGIDIGNEGLDGGYRSGGMSRFFGVTKGPRKIEHGYVEGGSLGKAEFLFSGITPDRFTGDVIPLDMQIRAFRSYKGDIETGIRGELVVAHPTRDVRSEPIPFVVDEYDLDEKFIRTQLPVIEDNQTRTADLFSTLVDDQGRMKVILRCTDDSQYLGVTRSGLYLRPAEGTFAWNFTKAYISIWFQMVMVIAFGVMFSTRLTGPVAMVSTAMCVLLGFFAEQIYYTRHYIDLGQERGGGPIESLIRLVRQDALTTQLELSSTTTRVIKALDAGIVYIQDALATAMPNLPKMLGTAEYAASGFDIFGALLLRHGTATLGYFLLAFLVSYFFIKSREIAA